MQKGSVLETANCESGFMKTVDAWENVYNQKVAMKCTS